MNDLLNKIARYCLLPDVASAFEEQYLEKMNRVALGFLAFHLPALVAIAFLNGTGPTLALVLTSLVLIGPVIAILGWESKRAISTVMGIAAMFMGGLLVHFGQGPVQIEMHFYFFVILALLAVFANPTVIIAAAIAVTLHHLLLWWILPSSVFNYDAPFWVVGVHATFVVLESIAACVIARSFFDNVIGLEKKVAARTTEIARRNRDMRRVLDSVDQGFFTIDRNGEMSQERSAAVETLLGPLKQRALLPDILRDRDAKLADWLEFALEDVFDGIMPLETTIDQLPNRINSNEQSLQLQYSPVFEDGKLAFLSVVVTDISAAVKQERLESEMHEMMAMIERISADKVGFLQFFHDAENIIEILKSSRNNDFTTTKRHVHTLKGNTSIFGLTRVSELCHQIEDYMEEADALPVDAVWFQLFESWHKTRLNLKQITTESSADINLNDGEYKALLLDILNAESKEVLATRVAAWKLEPTSKRLDGIAKQIRDLAQRIEKGDVTVRIYHSGLRTDPEVWSEFWSSIAHVVRNAVDHGIESHTERERSGKPIQGEIVLRTQIENGLYVVSIKDDGRGIDWDHIRKLAVKRGLPASNQKDLIEALFSDGFSTAKSVTETSGRGVGMAAVRAACDAMQGNIVVRSEFGHGTEFRFVFPVESIAPRTTTLLRKYGVEHPIWSDPTETRPRN